MTVNEKELKEIFTVEDKEKEIVKDVLLDEGLPEINVKALKELLMHICKVSVSGYPHMKGIWKVKFDKAFPDLVENEEED